MPRPIPAASGSLGLPRRGSRRGNRENVVVAESAPPTLVRRCELIPEAELRGILRNHNKASAVLDYKNTIRVIGFDLDQTLYPKSSDIDEAIQSYLYTKIAGAQRVSIEEAEKKFKKLYREGKGLSGGKTLQALGIPNGSDIIQEALEHADIGASLKPNPTTQRLLRRLKERYRSLDLITGASKKNTAYKLERLNIPEDLFSHIITADDASKSDGSAYQQWLDYYRGNDAPSFLYIGDRISSDHEIPSALGIKTMLVNVPAYDPEVSCLQLDSLHAIAKYLL